MKKEVNDFTETVKKIASVEGVEFLDDETIMKLAIDLLMIKAIRGVDESIQNLK